MKIPHHIATPRRILQLAAACCAGWLAAPALGADIQKADAADALNVGTSWIGGAAPTAGDNALWDSNVVVNTSSSLGVDTNWNGILIGYAAAPENQPATNIVINGGGVNTLTLGTGGINLRGTTSQSTPVRPNLTLNANVVLGSSQPWTVYGFSRVVTVDGAVSGAFDLSKASGGQLTLLRSNSFVNLIINGGTVNIGNGGTSGTLGSGYASIGNGTALIFNRSDDFAVANAFSGGNSGLIGGRFEKRGTGTLTLEGERTNFFGRCVLVAGTLAVTNEAQLGTNPGGASLTANALEFNGGTLRAAESFSIDDTKRGIQLTGATTSNIDVDNAKTLTVSNAITGTGSLRKRSAGMLALAAASTFSGSLTIIGGVVRLDHANAIPGGIGVTGGTSLVRFNGGVLGLAAGDYQRNVGPSGADTEFTSTGGFAAYGADRLVNLGGGAATLTWGAAQFFPAGGSLVFSANDSTHTITFANPMDLGGADRTISVNNGAAAVDGVLTGALSNGGLVKSGAGTLSLAGTSTYTGTTTVGNGTLLVNGQVDQTATTVNSAATLGGTGLLLGAVNCAGTLSPGASIGTLTVSNDVTLTGALHLEISRNGGTLTNDLLRGVSTLDVTGATLTVTNLGPDEPVAGNTFTLFTAQSVTGTFSATNLPALTDVNLSWDTTQLGSGILSVTGGIVSPSATNLLATVSSGNLNLSWPANAGWRLETQTNSLAVGLRTNWFNVPVTTNVLSLPLNSASPAVFFRLTYP